jgi:hypothetical protein
MEATYPRSVGSGRCYHWTLSGTVAIQPRLAGPNGTPGRRQASAATRQRAEQPRQVAPPLLGGRAAAVREPQKRRRHK